MNNTKKKDPKEIRRQTCYFHRNFINEIDYKNTEVLQKFVSNYQKILPRSRMGSCAKHQRMLATAVKQARYMGLLPYVSNQK